jgi:DNA recombination protein RmuC
MSVLAVVCIIAAMLAGGVGVWALAVLPASRREAAATREIERLQAVLAEEQKLRATVAQERAAFEANCGQIPKLETIITELRLEVGKLARSETDAMATLKSEREAHDERVKQLERMGAEIQQKFAALAAEVLGQNSERFLALVSERFEKHKNTAEQALEERQKAIGALVQPLTDTLAKFETKVGELELARVDAYRGINEQVKMLTEGQTNLRAETGRLVQALRQPKTRGRWGEYQLKNVLEMTGMTEHVDFIQEHTIQGDEGRLRPDVIVRLPGGKAMVVDAKTPLDAYLSAVEATDEAVREQFIASHARQVKDHIRNLASKEYWNALPLTPDFVIMFVPGEAFFATAIENDPGLFEHAIKNKVLLSTPTTFIALIKAIAYGWQQEKLAENAQAVADNARDLFERIKSFGGHLASVGDGLGKAVQKYNAAIGSLESRVLPAARKFQLLGVTPPDTEIELASPIELDVRAIQAPELREVPDSIKLPQQA